MRNLLKEIRVLQNKATQINMDNKSAIALSKNPILHDRSKYIDARFHFIKDCISRKDICVKYVKTEDQVAESLRRLSKLKFSKF